MGDLIDRQKAIERIVSIRPSTPKQSDYSHGVDVGMAMAIVAIKEQPSAQPERKTGEWIYGENDCQDGWYCSQCKGFVPWDYDYYGLDNIDFIKDFKTCPRCDARMISYTGMRKGE